VLASESKCGLIYLGTWRDPSEAREADRSGPARKVCRFGEWLTRRILAGLSDVSEPQDAHREEWSGYRSEERGASRRDSEEMLDRVSRSEPNPPASIAASRNNCAA